MNAKDYAKIIDVSRKFLDNYHKEYAKKQQERWSLEVWESHKENILKRYKLGNHRKYTDNIPVMILKSGRERDAKILGIYPIEEKENLRKYVRNHLVFKESYSERFDKELHKLRYIAKNQKIADGKIDKLGLFNAWKFLLKKLAESDCLKSNYVLKEGKRNPKNNPENKIKIDDIKKYNKDHLSSKALDEKFYKWCCHCQTKGALCRKYIHQRYYTEMIIEWKEKHGLIDEIIFCRNPRGK